MKDDVAEVEVDEDGNVIETEAIERVKPVLEVLEDEGADDEDEEDPAHRLGLGPADRRFDVRGHRGNCARRPWAARAPGCRCPGR